MYKRQVGHGEAGEHEPAALAEHAGHHQRGSHTDHLHVAAILREHQQAEGNDQAADHLEPEERGRAAEQPVSYTHLNFSDHIITERL